MTSAQVAEQIKSIFPLFYIQGKSSRVIIDLRCSSFFIMQADMLYTKKRKSLNFNNSRTYNFIFCFQRRDRVMNLSPYVALIQLFINMSMPQGVQFRSQKRRLFVVLWLFIVCLKLRFKDTTLFRLAQVFEYKCLTLSARCKLYIQIYTCTLHLNYLLTNLLYITAFKKSSFLCFDIGISFPSMKSRPPATVSI